MSHRKNVAVLSDELLRGGDTGAADGERPEPVSSAALDALADFAALVELWNRKMNLTAAREPSALAEVLFADALMLRGRQLIPEEAHVLDVGSGAGAPAIPLAILRPDVRMTLVEPLHKRVAFMRHALGSLSLGGRVTVLERKLQPGDEPLPGAPFDLAMSRATLAPADWLAVGLEHAPAVLVLTAGGDGVDREDAPAHAGATYTLPSSGAGRVIWKHERRG